MCRYETAHSRDKMTVVAGPDFEMGSGPLYTTGASGIVRTV